MSVTTLVVVPTFNELANLPLLVAGLMRHESVRMLVVDDNSPDGTGIRAEELASEHRGRIQVMHRTGPKGLGRAYIDGLKQAVGEPVQFVCQMDADLSHDPAQLPSLVAAAAHADVAVGSRYIPGGSIVNWPLRRRLLSRGANRYIRGVTGMTIRDCTSGYRCWRREVLATLPLDRFLSENYAFLVEMLYVAVKRGYRVAETPITFVERREGESKVSNAVLIESALMPWVIVKRPERYDEPA
jgi:dolichol-phosphate mannosyltransferase